MATTPQTAYEQDAEGSPSRLQELARRHLWMHFTRLSTYQKTPPPMIVRGVEFTWTCRPIIPGSPPNQVCHRR